MHTTEFPIHLINYLWLDQLVNLLLTVKLLDLFQLSTTCKHTLSESRTWWCGHRFQQDNLLLQVFFSGICCFRTYGTRAWACSLVLEILYCYYWEKVVSRAYSYSRITQCSFHYSIHSFAYNKKVYQRHDPYWHSPMLDCVVIYIVISATVLWVHKGARLHCC